MRQTDVLSFIRKDKKNDLYNSIDKVIKLIRTVFKLKLFKHSYLNTIIFKHILRDQCAG